YSADLIHRQAMRFLNAQHDQPFFLYLPYTLPHAEVIAPHDQVYDYYVKKFNEQPVEQKSSNMEKLHSDPYPHAAFAAMVSRLDKYVGEIMNTVKERGLEKNTLVIFASDNGPHKEGGGDPVFFNSNGGLRGIKRDLYEGGIRVPFIVYQLGVTKAGTINTMPAALWDLFPTFLQLAGVAPPGSIDGISLWPAITGQMQDGHAYFYWELHESGGKQAVRFGNWKGVRLNVSKKTKSPLELYDLATDPKEKNDVASKYPQVVKQIESIMQQQYVPNKDWPLTVDEMKKSTGYSRAD
ncbi:MAG: sulfatase-like hydrolase/transferase, partial [Flavisolibacter sp.]